MREAGGSQPGGTKAPNTLRPRPAPHRRQEQRTSSQWTLRGQPLPCPLLFPRVRQRAPRKPDSDSHARARASCLPSPGARLAVPRSALPPEAALSQGTSRGISHVDRPEGRSWPCGSPQTRPMLGPERSWTGTAQHRREVARRLQLSPVVAPQPEGGPHTPTRPRAACCAAPARPRPPPLLTCSMSSHSSRPTKMSSRGSRWRVPLLLTRNQEVTLILAAVWPWGWRGCQSGSLPA